MPDRTIPYSRQHIDEDDIAAVVRVLRSDWITQGPAIGQFEKKVADFCSVPHAVAVSSATAGLHLACLANGVGPGDVVWTSSLSFAASANCARYCGADIDFVDIDADTGNMSMKALAQKLETAQHTKRLPKVVIPVHYAGRACDMAAMATLKARYNFKIIEDAAHALGARYAGGMRIGNNPASSATVFSFHPVKPVTTGEGGMVMTHNISGAERLRLLRTHGITRETAHLKQKNMPVWYYEQQTLGFNYRLTDIQAALGITQMDKLDRFIGARRRLAERYHEKLQSLPLLLPPPDMASGWHLYAIRLDPARAKITRDKLFNKMRGQSIGVNVHYWPIHLQPYYRALGFKEGQFPETEKFAGNCLSLPLYPGLSNEDQDTVIEALKAFLNAAK